MIPAKHLGLAYQNPRVLGIRSLTTYISSNVCRASDPSMLLFYGNIHL